MASSEFDESAFSPVTQAAIEYKTVYDSYVEQGFEPAQALYLLAAFGTGNPGFAPGLSDETDE